MDTVVRTVLFFLMLSNAFLVASSPTLERSADAENIRAWTCDTCAEREPEKGTLRCVERTKYQASQPSNVCINELSNLSVTYYFEESNPRLNISFLWTQKRFAVSNAVLIKITCLSSPKLGYFSEIAVDPANRHFVENRAYFTYSCYIPHDDGDPVGRYGISVQGWGCYNKVYTEIETICEDESAAAAWKPDVSIDATDSERRVDVLVEPWTLCSSTNYKVRLLHCNDDSCDWEKMDVVKNLGTKSNALFQGLEPGFYKVKICTIPNGMSECPTNAHYIWSSTVHIASAPTHAGISDSPGPYKKSGAKYAAWVLLVGIASAAVVVIWITIWKYQKHSAPHKRLHSVREPPAILSTKEDSTTGSLISNNTSMTSSGICSMSGVQVSEIRQEKQVLLLFSDDFPEHTDVVYKFASFLNHRCACNTSLEAWHRSQEPNVIEWISTEIPKSDCIIIVSSEGACRKYDARKQNIRLRDMANIHRRDIFTQAMQLIKTEYIFSENSKPKPKIFMVWFPYSADHLLEDLQPHLICFDLMRYIDELVLAIHDLRPYENGQRIHIPEITSKNFAECDVGGLLKESIDAAECYVQNNPHWFSQRFTRATRSDSGVESYISNLSNSFTRDVEDLFFTGAPREHSYVNGGICSISTESMDEIENSLAINNNEFNAAIFG